MSTNTQGLLNQCPAVAACLCREAWVHSDHLMSGTCSLGFEDIEKRAPTGVQDALGEMVIFHHGTDSQVFHHNTLKAFSIGLSYLEMVISTLTIDLQMRFCNVLCCLRLR